MAHQKPGSDSPPKKREEEERRIDEEIADSFPASDPPSYAGGGAVGEPRRPKERTSKP
ncbi:MAG TPA: hypothetical protein VHY79_07150 [Rhizomicrobium sp.]|jgi:hypothetical protein|nr:hypothetical protein [Rhizomicrobium sp.]